MPQFDEGFLLMPVKGIRSYKVKKTCSALNPSPGRRPLSAELPWPRYCLASSLPVPRRNSADEDDDEDEESDTSVANVKPRGGKLARRARSFKEDFLEILQQMRSPSGAGGAVRSGSPHSPKRSAKGGSVDAVDAASAADKNPLRDLDVHVRQVQFALKHFRDVVSKNKLEMLSGNGTVVLETVTTIHGVLKSYVLNEQSSTLVSATNQVYQSVAKLIKLCDDVLLHGEKSLNKENVTEVIQLVEEAVQNLVTLAQDKIANRETNCKTLGHGNRHHHAPLSDRNSSYSMSDGPQRNSLPDIPLTPRERQILAQTSASVLDRHSLADRRAVMDRNSVPKSQSEESILIDTSPPPKPPLPGRAYHLSDSNSPPPLPPKRRNRHVDQLIAPDFDSSSLTDTFNSSSNSGGGGRSLISGLAASFDRISLRSKSPEDTSSLLSASAGSLDSVLNHSREEEEIQVLMEPIEESILSNENIITQGVGMNGSNNSCCCWESSSSTASNDLGMMNNDKTIALLPRLNHQTQGTEATQAATLNLTGIAPGSLMGADNIVCLNSDGAVSKLGRLPSQTESGFASMHSLRSSSQSYTASSVSSQQFSSSVSRSSQQSSVSTFSSSDSATSKTWQQKSTTTEANFLSTTQKIVSSSDLKADSVSSSTLISQRSESKASSITATEDSISPNLSPMSSARGTPPALPQKTRSRRRKDREVSQYDNMPSSTITTTSSAAMTSVNSATVQEQHLVSCSLHKSHAKVTTVVHSSSPDNEPPPLPLKKKHIMAYMEMFGNCSHQNNNEFLRHSVHTYNLLQAEWQQQEMSLTSTQSCSFSMVSSQSNQVFPAHGNIALNNIEAIDMPMSPLRDATGLPPALPPKRSRHSSVHSTASSPPISPPAAVKLREVAAIDTHPVANCDTKTINRSQEPQKPVLRRLELKAPPPNNGTARDRESQRLDSELDSVNEVNPLDELDIMHYLVIKKNEEEGPEVRGGHPDALIIHATKANKNDFLYQEAFLTTYRTFLSPLELIRKLCQRHKRFSCLSDPLKQRAAREAFSLLVRVVSDLTISDLSDVVLQTLMEFVYQLLCSGDLTMAKALRVKILEKYNAKKLYNSASTLLSSLNIYTRQASLLDFKSEQIAEQMTLLDANLFMKIEIPEVLIWAQEQNEERSPNLTRFTEHFNKMSYWARSRILEQNEAKDRERYVVKFIKIMKHLRKINNFNSYLALLSALDSAPIRRLEWQKHITEGLKEYCALIDSSSSFRAYRQALAETQPPCIPYIGLVLQDLTFVHIGNSDLLADGSINFSKRWQQFNIVENMKRFKKGTYSYKKHERIIAFFNTFDDYLCEEAMWQISESIKPRGGKKIS